MPVYWCESAPCRTWPMEVELDFRRLGIYTEKWHTMKLWIWKRYIPLLIDHLISNNFSSMTFFCAKRILRAIGRQSVRLYDSIRLKIQDSGQSNNWVLPYVLSNEARLAFNLWGKEINILILPTVVKFG